MPAGCGMSRSSISGFASSLLRVEPPLADRLGKSRSRSGAAVCFRKVGLLMEATVTKSVSGVVLRNEKGSDFRGSLVRVGRDSIVFEVYSPYRVVEPGESLQNMTVL